MKTLITVATAAALNLFVGVAAAQQVSFETLDADGDGAINKEEATAHEQLSAAFDAVDVDQSGTLSKDEFTAVMPE